MRSDVHIQVEATAWALFEAHRSGAAPLTHKAGSFVGQIAVDPAHPLTEKQRRWLDKLVERAGLRAGNDEGAA